jgi:hypothetical protein
MVHPLFLLALYLLLLLLLLLLFFENKKSCIESMPAIYGHQKAWQTVFREC